MARARLGNTRLFSELTDRLKKEVRRKYKSPYTPYWWEVKNSHITRRLARVKRRA